MENKLRVFRVERADRQPEIRQEFTLVPARVVHGDRVAVRIAAVRQVVHREEPFAAEITVHERHLRIDRRRFLRENFHRFLVPDEAPSVLREEEIRIRNRLDARCAARAARSDVLERQHDLELIGIRRISGRARRTVALSPSPRVLARTREPASARR